MNYYQHHIGDYDSATAHLSLVEDAIYSRLIRLYYRTEKPLPADINQVARLIRVTKNSEKVFVERVLSEFFSLTDSGWIQKRCDEEISDYHRKVDTNKANGSKGGRPKKQTQTVNSENPEKTQPVILGYENETQPKGNQEPRTINHKPLTNLSLCASEGIAEAAEILSDQKPAAPPSGWPDLKILNDKLRIAGYQPVTPRQLEITRVKFDLHFDETTLMSENRRLGKLVDWIGDKQRKRKDAWAEPESEKKPNPGNVDALWDRGEHQPPTEEQLAAFEQRKRQWAARDAALLAGVSHV